MKLIAGVDEVGRGCLAGPVIAAAVIFKNNIPGLKDSKKALNKKKTEIVFNNNGKFLFFFWVCECKGN